MAAQILSPVTVNPSNELKSDKTKEIHLNIKTKAENEIRQELFEDNTSDKSHVRIRKHINNKDSGSDFDAVLKYHHSIQEKVAEEMIELAHNLKHNCYLSNDIIKKDTEVCLPHHSTIIL